MATAFAIFCADDGSLTFYKRDTVPAVGDEFDGKVVGAVYTGFETSNYSSSTIPWVDNKTAIVSVSFVDEITPISTKFWFGSATTMTSFDGTNLNTSNVTNMQAMFNNCPNLVNLNVSGFDTGRVEAMGNMFSSCKNLTSLNISNFDTRNVKYMQAMFKECSSLVDLDVSNFNTSNVMNMNSMFYKCSVLTTIYVSDLWSTATVTNSTSMFSDCTSLVGAIPFDSAVTDATHANYQTGYLTYKFYADYLKNRFVIDGAELSDIGDKIRTLTGGKEGMTPTQMAEALGNYIDSLSAST